MGEKYKDQDEEEREMRMKLLQSQGKEDPESVKNKKKKDNRGLEKLYGKTGTANKPKGPGTNKQKPVAERQSGELLVEEERAVDDETNMLDSLTGIPLPEDELLFAIPVVAPYNTILQYKYK